LGLAATYEGKSLRKKGDIMSFCSLGSKPPRKTRNHSSYKQKGRNQEAMEVMPHNHSKARMEEGARGKPIAYH
jgi:hypothetical protein